jgi:hypothetical protein
MMNPESLCRERISDRRMALLPLADKSTSRNVGFVGFTVFDNSDSQDLALGWHDSSNCVGHESKEQYN